MRRVRQLGHLAQLDAGTETLNEYVTATWAPTYAAMLAPKTRATYAASYDFHLAPTLGTVPLRELTPPLIARWQADRIAAGCGPVAVQSAAKVLGSSATRRRSAAHPSNPARLVRKVRAPRAPEVRPLAPTTVERMRTAARGRDAALISGAGLRRASARRGSRPAVGRRARQHAADRACAIARSAGRH